MVAPSRRAWASVLALTLAAGSLGLVQAPAFAAPTPKVTISNVEAVVGSDRLVSYRLSCSGAACAGSVKLKVAGASTAAKKYSLRKGKAKTYTVKLSVKVAKKLSSSRRGVLTVTPRAGSGAKKTTKKVTVKAAKAQVRLRTNHLAVGHGHVVALNLDTVSARATRATVRLKVAGVAGGGSQGVSFPARSKGKDKIVKFVLSDAQVEALGTGSASVAATLSVSEKSPEKVTSTQRLTLKLDHDMGGGDGGHGGGHGDGHDGHDDTPVPAGESSAYARGWNPTEYDTCTRAEHESYAVTGVDGKLYPSWHPAMHTRSDGSTCTFGHEHGDDPENSDIFDWVVEQYRTENPAANGVPFGYGSEQLSVYSTATNSTYHRHEDDPGHKVVVSNDQEMGVSFTDRWGERQALTCDTLIKAHQGSHSSDATKNNTHELVYALQCNDGTKLLTTVMTNYGNSNELLSSCTRPFISEHGPAQPVTTLGSILPDGEGGSRLIPTAECIETYVKNGTENGQSGSAIDDRRGSPASSSNGWWWAGYEQWQSFTSLEDENGKEIARFEPWFGLQNPSRYYTGNGASDTTVGYLNDLAWEEGPHQQWSPWKEQREASATKIDRKSPQAWFKGSIRDAWLTTTKVDNRDATSTVIHTDPWGKQGAAKPFTGSVRTYLSRTSNVEYVARTTPSVINRSVRTAEALTRKGASAPLTMNFFYDYGRDEHGRSLRVHAPN